MMTLELQHAHRRALRELRKYRRARPVPTACAEVVRMDKQRLSRFVGNLLSKTPTVAFNECFRALLLVKRCAGVSHLICPGLPIRYFAHILTTASMLQT
jgi:hypothetical protein